MSKTSKNRSNFSRNKTKKNMKCNKITKYNYKTCKSQMYKSIYGGRYTNNLFF
jgi:hypothetical protein